MGEVVWAWGWAEHLVKLAQHEYENGNQKLGNRLMNCAIDLLDGIESAREKWEKGRVYPTLL